ncbi:MAG: sigma-54 dependent transcriptional regulator [Desulfobulbaceae bacterium]|nr:sigma-54 dependent transcriptional regulator [Desulfobulbaceae bacterium]
MADSRLLIVDDEQDMLAGLTRLLGKNFDGLEIITAESGEKALQHLQQHRVDVALVDILMPGISGLELLTKLEQQNQLVTAVIMTAYGNIDVAVDAMKRGAYDFITKPFEKEKLLLVVRKALERSRLLRENENLKKRVNDRAAIASIIGNSPPVQSLLESIRTIAPTNYTLLVRGESGTGKELVAKAVHEQSGRSAKPLVVVNCPAIPEHLLESELFGHRKGAFTGADKDFKGLFAEADGGTICLDEIGDIPVNIQTKLLRVLQEQEIRPLGGSRSIQVDVRVIGLTNQNLEQKISEHSFRDDLFHRLNVVTLRTPSLRDIRNDIPLLAAHCVNQTCRELGVEPKIVSAGAMEKLMKMEWPGNVRELQNVIRRTILFCPDTTVRTRHLRISGSETGPGRLEMEHHAMDPDGEIQLYKEAKEKLNRIFEEQYIRQLLSRTEGNVSQAARLSGLTRAALQKIMRRSGIRSGVFRDREE